MQTHTLAETHRATGENRKRKKEELKRSGEIWRRRRKGKLHYSHAVEEV